MKLATMMVALVAAVASLAVGDAFVMPSAAPAGLARNAGPALAPSSQPAPSRSAGEGGGDRQSARDICVVEEWKEGKVSVAVRCCGWYVGLRVC